MLFSLFCILDGHFDSSSSSLKVGNSDCAGISAEIAMSGIGSLVTAEMLEQDKKLITVSHAKRV